MTETNETTRLILNFLFRAGIYAWRQNTTGIPIHGEGRIVGFRPSGMAGLPDILGICGPSGKFLGIEIKTGKDRISDVQETFHNYAKKLGAIILVVKDFEDFQQQWQKI